MKKKNLVLWGVRGFHIREKKKIGLIDPNVYKLYVINVYWYKDDVIEINLVIICCYILICSIL